MAVFSEMSATAVENVPSKEAVPQGLGVLHETGYDTTPLPTQEPYSVYTTREKWFIVCMVAVSGLYSPLPANIYFPAIPTLSKVFGESIEALNQSVTIYLVFQGICESTTQKSCKLY